MKRFALILLLLGLGVPFASGADNPVGDLVNQARAAAAAGKFDDAIALYEQVLTQHLKEGNSWFDAQMGIAQALAKKGDLAGAAKAAHLCLDAAPNPGAFDDAVSLTAGILSAQDKSVDRANQFLNFEQTGPAGGQTNPMDAVGYPSLPDREAAFTALRRQAGDDDADASRLRATTYLLTGKPRDALAQFADAFRRSGFTAESVHSDYELVAIGLRAVRSHRAGLDKDLQFVIFGPNGPGGKPGAADGLSDPFAEFLPAPPAVGEGGLAQLSPEDLAALRQVRDAAQLYAGDPLLFPDIRRAAVGALVRTTSALDGWGAPGQKDWYLQWATDSRTDEPTRGLLLTGAELAARGRGLNFGPVHALWTEIDANWAAKNIPPTKGMDETRKQFDGICADLAKISFPKLAPKLLKTPAKF